MDARSFRVDAYFEETKLGGVRLGAPVDVRLMSGGARLGGHVASVARAIGDPEVEGLLSNVNPTFHWVRLAQRIPVRITLDAIPEAITLSAGMTCTVDDPRGRRIGGGRVTVAAGCIRSSLGSAANAEGETG